MTRTRRKESGLIVVGVDGSDESITALKWAIEEAHTRGARVRAMNIWNYPPTGYGVGIDMGAVSLLTEETIDTAAQTVVDQAVEKALVGVDEPPFVERVVRQGSPARELLAESKDADLLVVGQRGHGGFIGLLMGSVANQVMHHATCPTVVIPRENTVS
jgi:nucleotide-binding universal stress UspA family protein